MICLILFVLISIQNTVATVKINNYIKTKKSMSQLPQIFEKILSDLEKIDLTGLDSGTRVSSQNDFVISLLEDLFLNFVFYLAQREGKPLSGISSTKAAQLYINRIRTEFDCPNHMGWELALEIKELGIEESIQKILNS